MRFYLVHKLRYKYFRFAGRHFEFLDSPYETENSLRSAIDPEKPWGTFTPPKLPHRCVKIELPYEETYAFEVWRPPSWIFPLPVWSHSILMSANGMLDPESKGKAVDILLISCLEAEIHAIKVYRLSSWIFPLPVWSHSLLICPNGKLDPKNIGIAVGISFIYILEAEIHAFEVLRPPSWITHSFPVWLHSI